MNPFFASPSASPTVRVPGVRSAPICAAAPPQPAALELSEQPPLPVPFPPVPVPLPVLAPEPPLFGFVVVVVDELLPFGCVVVVVVLLLVEPFACVVVVVVVVVVEPSAFVVVLVLVVLVSFGGAGTPLAGVFGEGDETGAQTG
jgi:hypothetical protein